MSLQPLGTSEKSVSTFLDGMPTSTSCLEWAIYYASKDLFVFPVYEPLETGRCSCGDSECMNVGKHPRVAGGFKAATVGLDLIRDWWTRWPNASVGIATGAVSGIVVLDIDPKRGGLDSLATLEEKVGPIPMDAAVRTGGDGAHAYLAHSGTRVPSRQNLLPGIDVRGDGGYVVAPPSVHESGQRYAWKEGV